MLSKPHGKRALDETRWCGCSEALEQVATPICYEVSRRLRNSKSQAIVHCGLLWWRLKLHVFRLVTSRIPLVGANPALFIITR